MMVNWLFIIPRSSTKIRNTWNKSWKSFL